MLVAVHQPNYLPWLGLFHKLRQCDVFVLLDDVQIQKTGSSWVNRTQVLVSGSPRWLSIPIHRPSGVERINQTTILGNQAWRKSHRGLLHQAYRRAPYYRSLSGYLDGLYENPSNSLLDFNLTAIRGVLNILELSDAGKFVLGSSFDVKTKGTSRLIELVKQVGGDSYLCGNGSSGYLEPNEFDQASVKLVWQNFTETNRRQFGTTTFIPGLSVIDALLNIGPAETRTLLQSRSSKSKHSLF